MLFPSQLEEVIDYYFCTTEVDEVDKKEVWLKELLIQTWSKT